MAGIGKEGYLFVCHLLALLVEFLFFPTHFTTIEYHDEQQHNHSNSQDADDFLPSVHLHIFVDAQIDGIQVGGLVFYLLVLHVYQLGILGCDKCRLKIVHALVGLALQNVHR